MQCSHLSLMNLLPNMSISSMMDLSNIVLRNTIASKYHGRSLSCRKVNGTFSSICRMNLQFMLHLGMDEPNVNVKFEKLLQSSEIMKISILISYLLEHVPLILSITHSEQGWMFWILIVFDSFIIDVNFFSRSLLEEQIINK